MAAHGIGARSRSWMPIISLLVANAISLFGEALTAIAIPWYVYDTTGSAAKMGIVGFFTFLPRVLASFLGGGVIDRLGFRRTSLAADVLSGLSVAAIPLAHHSIGLTFPLLIVFVVCGSLFDAPGSTARESLVPELAGLARVPLERINAIYQMVQRLAFLLGPAIAGVLIALIGASNVLFIDAVTFGISLLLIGLLVPRGMPNRETDDGHGGTYWSELMGGLRFIRADAVLLWLAGSIAVTNFLEAPFSTVTMPVLIREHYGSAEKLGLLFSAFGAGAVISTIAFASIGHRLPRFRTFAIGFLVIAVVYATFAAAVPYPLMIAVSVAMGLAGGPINPIIMTVRQERVPERMRARVFGTFTSLAWVTIPLGQLAGGLAVERFGPRWTLVVIAACFAAVSASMFLMPALKAMDRQPGTRPSAARSA